MTYSEEVLAGSACCFMVQSIQEHPNSGIKQGKLKLSQCFVANFLSNCISRNCWDRAWQSSLIYSSLKNEDYIYLICILQLSNSKILSHALGQSMRMFSLRFQTKYLCPCVLQHNQLSPFQYRQIISSLRFLQIYIILQSFGQFNSFLS